MKSQLWLTRISIWVGHLLGWVLLTALIDYSSFIKVSIKNDDDYHLVLGLLCVSSAAISSGFHLVSINSNKDHKSSLAKAENLLYFLITSCWLVCLWVIVLNLPSILSYIGTDKFEYFSKFTKIPYYFY